MTSAPAPRAGAPRRGVILGLVVLGGAVGVLARALLLLPIADPAAAAWATAAINVAGSLLLGIVVGWLGDRHPQARALLGTGVLGGFTTYSAFAVQTVTMGAADVWRASLLVVVAVGLALAGAIAGLLIGRRLAGAPGPIESPESAE